MQPIKEGHDRDIARIKLVDTLLRRHEELEVYQRCAELLRLKSGFGIMRESVTDVDVDDLIFNSSALIFYEDNVIGGDLRHPFEHSNLTRYTNELSIVLGLRCVLEPTLVGTSNADDYCLLFGYSIIIYIFSTTIKITKYKIPKCSIHQAIRPE